MKPIFLLTLFAVIAHGQIPDPLDRITLETSKDWSDGSENVEILGIKLRIDTDVLQQATTILNLINVSMKNAMAYGSITMDVPFKDRSDSLAFTVWGYDRKLRKGTTDFAKFGEAIYLYRFLFQIFQFAYTNFQ